MNDCIDLPENKLLTIQQLEAEIEQLKDELAIYKSTLQEATATLKKCNGTIYKLKNNLIETQLLLRHSVKSMDTGIGKLHKENNQLKLSCDFWIKRTISLEMQLLTVKK